MTAQILDGKATAAAIKSELTARVAALKARGITPGLGTLLVGDDPGSRWYVNGKHKDCAEVGIASIQRELPGTASRRTSRRSSASSTPTRSAPATSSNSRSPRASTPTGSWS